MLTMNIFKMIYFNPMLNNLQYSLVFISVGVEICGHKG